MAFVDTFMGDSIINLSQRTGKTGLFDDMLFVQIMLKFLFTENPVLSRLNPVKGLISVTGLSAPDTPLLIAAFQKHVMKRSKPEGFINTARGNDIVKGRFTIVQMNQRIEITLAATQSPINNVLELIAQMSPFAEPFLNRIKHYEIPRDK